MAEITKKFNSIMGPIYIDALPLAHYQIYDFCVSKVKKKFFNKQVRRFVLFLYLLDFYL